MDSIGDCYDCDDRVVLGLVQTELLNRQRWKTRIELSNALFEYLEIFHTAVGATAPFACSPRPGTNSS